MRGRQAQRDSGRRSRALLLRPTNGSCTADVDLAVYALLRSRHHGDVIYNGMNIWYIYIFASGIKHSLPHVKSAPFLVLIAYSTDLSLAKDPRFFQVGHFWTVSLDKSGRCYSISKRLLSPTSIAKGRPNRSCIHPNNRGCSTVCYIQIHSDESTTPPALVHEIKVV